VTYLHRLVARVVADLGAQTDRFALVGGLAVSVHVEARFTRDLDLAVAVSSDDEAQALIQSLTKLGYTVEAVLEHQAAGRLATARLLAPEESESGANVDLLFASSGIEPEIAAEAAPAELPGGVLVPVARPGHLVVLKILSADETNRPQDRVDLANLLRVCSEGELERARRGASLVVGRGFARGRDIEGDLAKWIGKFRKAE